MMISRLSNASLLLLLLLLGACGKKEIPSHADYIPADAVSVYGVNFKSIMETIGKEKLFDLSLFSALSSQDEKSKALFDKLERSGVDYQNTVYIYQTQLPATSNNTNLSALSSSVVYFVVPLKKDASLETLLKEEMPELKVEELDEKKYAEMENVAMMWAKDVAIVMVNSKEAKEDLKRAFSPSEKLALKSETFAKLAKQNDHIVTYGKFDANTFSYFKDLGIEMGWFPSLEGTGVMNFEKGKVSMNGEYIIDKNFGKKIIFSENLSKAFLEQVPEEESFFTMAVNLDTEVLLNILKQQGLEAAINQNLAMMGMEAKDLMQMLSGEIAISVAYLDDPKSQIPVRVYAQLGVAKKEEFKKLAKQLMALGSMTSSSSSDQYITFNGFHIFPTENRLVVTNSDDYREGDLNKTAKKGTLGEASSSAMYYYVDASFVKKLASNPLMSMAFGQALPQMELISQLGNMDLRMGTEKNGVIAWTTDWKVNDDSQNSLLVLAGLVQELITSFKDKNSTYINPLMPPAGANPYQEDSTEDEDLLDDQGLEEDLDAEEPVM